MPLETENHSKLGFTIQFFGQWMWP